MLDEARRKLPKLTSERFYRYLRELGWSPDSHAGPARRRHWVKEYDGPAMLTYDDRMAQIKADREANQAEAEGNDRPFFDDE